MSIPFIARPYQELAIEHIIAHKRCALWLPMGMGKSVSTLTTLDELSIVEDIYPALILAPYRVAQTTWPGEAAKWNHISHLDIQPILGDAGERQAAMRKDKAIYTINYENIPWFVEELGGKWPFKTIVADESTKLKSYRTRQGGARTRALAKVAFRSERFIELTGTPSPKGLTDLWGQAFFLDQGARLGRTYTSFEQRWFRRGWDGFSLEPLPHAQAEIQEKLSDICLSIDPKDYFDLRDPIETSVYIDLPQKARRHYDDMEKRMFTEIEKNPIEAFNAAARTNACSQIASGAAYIENDVTDDNSPKARQWCVVHDEKLEALKDIIEEAGGAPILAAYHFKSDLARLKKAFPQGRVFDKNPQTEKDWNAGKVPLMFAHPLSAGHGSNLQYGGNIIVYFTVDWNLEGFDQILGRIGPIRQLQSGLDRNVFVYYILARNTIDEDKMARLRTKASVQEVLLKAMKRRKQ